MTEAREIKGQCLCGATTVRAAISKPVMRACHFDMCRQHRSSMYMSLATDPGSVMVDGPATSFRPSDWAERGFCETCGSTLWDGAVAGEERHISAGLFGNAAGASMALEFFVDERPKGYALKGNHRTMSAAECRAEFASSGA